MLQRRVAQPDVGVHRRRVAHHRQHRQVAHAVAVAVTVRQAEVFLLGVDSHPACLGRGRHDRRQQPPGSVTIDELQAIGHIVVDLQVLGERSHRDVQRARDQHLPQPELTRLVDELVGAREDRRPQHGVEQLVGHAAQAVFGLTPIADEEDVVEQPPVVEVGRHEQRDAHHGGDCLGDALEQTLLVARREGERMHQVGANQRPVQIVEGGSAHPRGGSLYHEFRSGSGRLRGQRLAP